MVILYPLPALENSFTLAWMEQVLKLLMTVELEHYFIEKFPNPGGTEHSSLA